MIVPIITALLPLIPELLEYIAKERAARQLPLPTAPKSEDVIMLETVKVMVDDIGRAHPDWTDAQKASFAASASKAHLYTLGIHITDSVANLLVELYAAKAAAERREDTNGGS